MATEIYVQNFTLGLKAKTRQQILWLIDAHVIVLGFNILRQTINKLQSVVAKEWSCDMRDGHNDMLH